jgi:hypothetical protein
MFLSAREAGGEARRGGSWRFQNLLDLRPCPFGIVDDAIGPEADNPPAFLFKDFRSPLVGLDLKGVVVAVDLDDEILRNTGKVGKEWADRMLSSEFQTIHSMSAQ